MNKIENPETEAMPDWDQSGLCAEAQADGVPCTELGRNCEVCEQASEKDESIAQ